MRLSSVLMVTFFIVILWTQTAHLRIGFASESGTEEGTVVGGTITTNTTYLLSASPYIVTDNVRVLRGVKLTIEPGVVLEFNGSYGLTVDGVLLAEGTDSNRIVFTSHKPSPQPGDWNGINFTERSAGKESVIKNCVIEYSEEAITGNMECPDLVQANIIQKNLHAFYMYLGNLIDHNPKIIDNTFQNNGAKWLATESYWSVAGWNSMYFEGSNQVNISSNLFQHNNGSIFLVSLGGWFFNNNVTNSGDDGVVTQSYISLRNNRIENNALAGIYCVSDGGSGGIQGNSISENKIGIIIVANPRQTVSVRNNNIFNNTDYNLYNDRIADINATQNWWGTTNASEIAKGIYDYYDNFDKGIVSFDPPSTSMIVIPEFPSFQTTMLLLMIPTLLILMAYRRRTKRLRRTRALTCTF